MRGRRHKNPRVRIGVVAVDEFKTGAGRRCMWQASHVLYVVRAYSNAVRVRFCDVFLSFKLFIANTSKPDWVYLTFKKDF